MNDNQFRNEILLIMSYSTFNIEKALYDIATTSALSLVREEVNGMICEQNRTIIENTKRKIQINLLQYEYSKQDRRYD